MRRGTTPTHTFNLPFDTSGVVKDLRVTYAQGGAIVVEKSLADCTLDGNKIVVQLAQEDTLKLANAPVKWQVKILTVDGKVIASKTRVESCLEILNEEVL